MRLLLALSFVLSAGLYATSGVVAKPAEPGPPQRVFVSGHSLTDNPLPLYLARIAASLGQPVQWNRQYIVGSSIRDRTRGRGHETGWSGYSSGYNRDGEGLNVVEELRHPRTTDGKPYDTLIITEQHGVLDSIVFNDTLRYLRHYHDRFIDGNPRGQTWFYEPWLGVIDKADPSRWIAYERAAAPMWHCVLSRINTSLAAEGRTDRIEPHPASLALVTLVERASRGQVPGLSAAPSGRVLDKIFHDQVHLTPLGSYYLALGTYAATFRRPPEGAWAPEGMDATLAASLQKLAWEAVSAERVARKPLPLNQCSAYMRGFRTQYFEHMRDGYWAQQSGNAVQLTYRRLKQGLQWRWRLWRDFDGDPFSYDPATDKGRWLAAP
jgi:hypothetical protein